MIARLCVLLVVLLVACAPIAPTETPDGIEVTGRAVAGPTCPVVSEPPDPACDDRPVEDAELVFLDENSDEVTRVRTDADGRFSVELPPGSYQLVPQPVEGLMGTAHLVEFELRVGESIEPIILGYDTGIR